MGSCCAADAPTPPNPLATAAAQTGTNVNTAIANAYLNSTNQITPTGSLTYDQTANYSYTDPTTGSTYQIPRFTATQSLTPAQQAIQNQTEQTKFNTSSLANQQSGQLQNTLGSPFSYSPNTPPAATAAGMAGVPQAATTFGDAGNQQTSLGNYGQQQTGFGDAGNIATSYGPADNFSADRSRVEQSLFDRINPQLDRQRAGIEQHLADEGIRYGSTAYTSAMDDYNRQANDARLAVTAQGGAEQQRLNSMAQAQGQFQNAAQQQAYTEAQGRGQFANTAQAQQFQEQLGAGNFGNAAQAQQYQENMNRALFGNQGLNAQLAQQQAIYNAQNSGHTQSLSEQYALRNQPINEVTSLLSGSQVSQPQWAQTPQTNIPTVDVGALINTNFNQQFQNYQTQQNATNQLLGGILGAGSNIGAATYLKSDRRTKENIHRVGTVFAAEPQEVEEPNNKQLPIYQYSYKDDPSSTRHVGPMAQDVEKIDPSAVAKDKAGMRYIDTRKVMGSIMRAA